MFRIIYRFNETGSMVNWLNAGLVVSVTTVQMRKVLWRQSSMRIPQGSIRKWPQY